jgi:hypothetical protein
VRLRKSCSEVPAGPPFAFYVAARLVKCGMNDATQSSKRSPGRVPRPTPISYATPPMDRVIRVLVPSGSRREIRALFGDRVSWSAIKHWRKGRTKPPQWAVDRVRQHAAAIFELQDASEPGAALMAWIAKNGRPHRPKGKGRGLGGLPHSSADTPL